ncbi:MAG: type II secretion system F family protein, partial [bacterium]|nr:type II secretion system F family protein [bacterium]
LEAKGMSPILIEKEGDVKGSPGLSMSLFERVKPIDLIMISRNLSIMIKAGISITESLDILINDSEKRIIKKILGEAKFNIQKGQPLSATFSYYKKYFPPVFVGLIKAGEVSGNLSESFAELAKYMSREYSLKRKIRSALAYPAILMTGSTGIITLLLVFVLPRLAKSFAASNVELPMITKIFMGISLVLSKSILADLLIFIFFVWLFFYFRKTDFGRKIFYGISLRIPVIKDLVKKSALIRLSRTLGGLIGSGLVIMEALELTAEAVGNSLYKKALLKAIGKIKSGIPLSKALGGYNNLFPHIFVNMLAVSEQTGSMESVLKTFSDFYDEEIDNTLKDMTTMIEPIMLLIMGLIIGAIALSVLLPVYQLVGKFS